MITQTPEEARTQIVSMVREFAQRELEPIVAEYERDDIVPLDVIEKMKEMGLFGITVPEEYGGMGLDYTTFAMIFEELSKSWMSISGVIGTHHIMAHVVANFGTEEQKQRYLPRHGQWKEARRAGPHRAQRRQRRPVHRADRGKGRRRVCHQRHQDVHHQRPIRRYLCADDQDRP